MTEYTKKVLSRLDEAYERFCATEPKDIASLSVVRRAFDFAFSDGVAFVLEENHKELLEPVE